MNLDEQQLIRADGDKTILNTRKSTLKEKELEDLRKKHQEQLITRSLRLIKELLILTIVVLIVAQRENYQ